VVDGKKLAPVKITLVKEGGNPWFRVTLIEGKNNQIRKMFEAIGHRVAKLKRIQIGFLSDPHLALGCFRTLTPGEIEKFKRLRQKLPD
jgi:23S rRNA pseudouridine2605 synthase